MCSGNLSEVAWLAQSKTTIHSFERTQPSLSKVDNKARASGQEETCKPGTRKLSALCANYKFVNWQVDPLVLSPASARGNRGMTMTDRRRSASPRDRFIKILPAVPLNWITFDRENGLCPATIVGAYHGLHNCCHDRSVKNGISVVSEKRQKPGHS